MQALTHTFPRTTLSRLTLGTAQLGMAYGIANRNGIPDDRVTNDILNAAWAGGVHCLDTARMYGDAEGRIGRWVQLTTRRPLMISKLPAVPVSSPADFVERSFRLSIEALGVDAIDGYLAHRANDLQSPIVLNAMQNLVRSGRIRAYGVSVYRPEQIDAALRLEGLSLIQCPINLFDQRIIRSELLERCRERDVTVFARSVFLQGGLLLEPDALPPFLSGLKAPLVALRKTADACSKSVTELSMLAVRDLAGVASIVIGAETAGQIAELARICTLPPLPADLRDSLWKLGAKIPASLSDISAWPRER